MVRRGLGRCGDYHPISQGGNGKKAATCRCGRSDTFFPFNANNFRIRVFQPALKRSGIQNFRFHDLRHTFASRLANHGVDLYTIAKLMGHHSIRMTERYAHLSDMALRNALEKVAPKLAPSNSAGGVESGISEQMRGKAGVAQLVERVLAKHEVVGSKPITRSKLNLVRPGEIGYIMYRLHG